MTYVWASEQRRADLLPGIVIEERMRAVDKFGVQHHSPGRWLHIIGEEFGEAVKEINEMDMLADRGITNVDGVVDPRMRSRLRALTKELAQTAAMCIHAICDLEGFVREQVPGATVFPTVEHGADPARWWELG